jgi:hypothetical protein
MNGIKLIALAAALVVYPAASHAQQPDSLKRDTTQVKPDTAKAGTAKADTAKKETTGEKIGRQTGASLEKGAKTTERNAKVLSKRGADNTKEGAKDAAADIKDAAKKVKEKFKKATADTIRPQPKP